jgi:hypothetical protein
MPTLAELYQRFSGVSSSVSDLHSLYADPGPIPDPNPGLKLASFSGVKKFVYQFVTLKQFTETSLSQTCF